ncbi:MaoC domain protein [Sandaracinus amylolyticus]|uniref:MaoC domain protein n=2 Tax=Sandaracinus amylolyticus TaxID=927083 RepID=A0A0F6SEF2_9BACT|nr:MaoC domain protein [Sandaracinus amylolyticus]
MRRIAKRRSDAMTSTTEEALRFARLQKDTLRGMGSLALAGLVPGPLRGMPPIVPGEWIERRVPAPPDALIDAYCDAVGARRDGTVPAHLFPQWAFAMSGELLGGLRYPLLRAVNAGCRLEVRGELPRGRDLIVRGRLAAIDDDGRRAVITQRFTTGVEGATQLVNAEVRAFVPLAKGRRGDGAKKDAPKASAGARELGRFEVGPRAGWEFALLTGDFNPIHWARPWARASGFRGVILHGFGTYSRAWEIVRRARGGLAELDARFTRPLVLPGSARVLADGDAIWVVDANDAVVMEGRAVR